MTAMRWFVLLLGAMALSRAETQAEALDLGLPTDNDAIYRGDGPAFYQFVDRDSNGEKTTPWQGGQYGFVRNPKQTSAGLVYTKFHEGIDIKPLQRDANDEPLDEIKAIADGKVVHVNTVPGYSNYGRYVVVEHHWDGCDYYSLYGHLSTIAVKPGQTVQKGEKLAVMGYTGVGIDKRRAHVHLELNLLINRHFEKWHDTYIKGDPNHNGVYNGLNMAGLDVARLYLALHKDPSLTLPQFFKQEEVFYKVILPKTSNLEIAKRYPWLVQGGGAGMGGTAWEVSFARSSLPIAIQPAKKKVKLPELSYVKKSGTDYSNLTRGEVAGVGDKARLTLYGITLMKMLTFPE